MSNRGYTENNFRWRCLVVLPGSPSVRPETELVTAMSTPGSTVAPIPEAVPPLSIDLLGGFLVTVHGAPMRKLRTRQGNRLLALLALSRGKPVDRMTVAGRLWMDSPSDAAALALLRRALADLRDALGPEAARIQSVSQFAFRLDLSGGGAFDLDEFDRAVAEDSAASRDRAIELYRGPLMPDLDAVYDPDGELRNRRDRCREVFLNVLQHRAEARQAARHEDAVADFRRLLNADPTREPASRALMELLVNQFADRAGAIAEYLRLRRALSRDLGTSPDPATRALYERIQTGDLSKFKARSGDFTLSAATPIARQSTTPPGPITLLFSDTCAGEGAPAHSDAAGEFRKIVGANEGELLVGGDGYRAVFAFPHDAIAAASEFQSLAKSAGDFLAPRIAIHTGVAALSDGRQSGAVAEVAADLLAAGHPGQILISAVAAGLLRGLLPPDVSLRDLGPHWFRHGVPAEPVFQLTTAGQRENFPPIRSLKPAPNNLPNRLTRFIGREAEIDAVRGHLHRNRLVTLTATGGAGKTRLALQVAADSRDEFPDGVWMVEYASISDPAFVPRVTAAALGMQEPVGQSLETALLDRLSGKRTLLLLDNCEHLLDACARLIAAMLTACPDLKVLATSREPLGITGEQTYRVPSLTLPAASGEGIRSAKIVAGCESVRFFVDRAALARPDFALTDPNAPAVAHICRRLDGIPLALELATARLRTLPLEQIADRLDDRFRLLGIGGDRTALPRQQTLRALIDWSYDLLTGPEKTLFLRLSVFVGGWTAESAQAVCGFAAREAGDIDELLSRLVDKSLILAHPREGATRFDMLETLRQYATEKRETGGDSAALLQRHRRWFVGLVEEAESHLRGAAQSEWLDRLEAEQDNLRAALTRFPTAIATPHGGDAADACTVPFDEDAHRLAGSLIRFWIIRGHVAEGWQHVTHVLQETGEPRETAPIDGLSPRQAAALGKALHAAGQLAHLLAEYETALRYLERSLGIRRTLGDEEGIASTVNVLGDVLHFQGDYPAAMQQHEEALAIYRRLQHAPGIAVSLGNLGNVLWSSGDFEAARAALEESVTIQRAAGNRHGAGVSLTSLGSVAILCGDFVAAGSFAEEGLTISREVGNRQGVGISLANLGMLAMQDGDLDRAKSLHRESLVLFRELNDRLSLSYSLFGLITVALRESDGWKAVVLFGAADAIREIIRAPLTPSEKEEQRVDLDAARALIGDTSFAAAWDRGRAMNLDQALAYALSDEKSVA